MESKPIVYRHPLIHPRPILGTAVLRFKESGWEEFKSILDGYRFCRFEYQDQDGLRYVRLEDIGGGGLVTLIDINKRTGEPKVGAHEYTVCLYTDGELTLVTQ